MTTTHSANGITTATTTELTPQQRLDAIAARLVPCSPPDIFGGYDLCTCGAGRVFPCATTEAAWLARGLDPATENRRVIDSLRPLYEDPDWDR